MSRLYISLIASVLMLSGCGGVSVDDLVELEVGMARGEVMTRLGRPTECAGALTRPSCRWGDTERFISIQFEDDHVLMISSRGLH